MTHRLDIRPDDLSSIATRRLLELHLRGMHAHSPAGHVTALDIDGLKGPDITLWSAWQDEALCGIGALRQVDVCTGEIKSMRTHPDHLRKGVSAAILAHIIAEAKRRGLRRLSLETGSGPAFEPAIALYEKRGFAAGGPFAEHRQTHFNRFFHLDLEPDGRRSGRAQALATTLQKDKDR